MVAWVHQSDSEFMLSALRAYGSLTTMQLIELSQRERGCGLTPRARVYDLRKRGHVIEVDRVPTKSRRAIFSYTLIASLPRLEADSSAASGTTADLPPVSSLESEAGQRLFA